ncbi:phosphoserine phosphatase SerB [Sanguibacter sp. HDW7]|uniref:phosphoserine phosphatase SerB n=1 Tax=Sanguibacter sp. HDW7 TaxID=2714931 RepID=UPI002107042F|nr:phosphoserine phosphatase SerB [Sanguibacter sp. HDW7]
MTTPQADRWLLVMDVDSTFITAEVIELLAAHAGAREEVAAVTSAAMRGEIDFGESLERRVALLAGLPDSVFDDVLAEVTVTPGALELVAEAQSRGWVVGLVSGGFEEIVVPLAARAGITRVRANRLESEGGTLTGRTTGPVIDREVKEETLRAFAAEEGIDMSRTIAIGDGANDLAMIGAAAIGIAFDAKPVVREQAPFSIDGPRLDAALEIIDREVAALTS